MGIKRIGDWNKARQMTNNLNNDIELANTIVLKKIGLKTERLIIKWIASQPSSWPKLSEDYQEWKSKKGLSNLMLRKSSDMINRITSDANENRAFIGVKKNAINKEGEKLANIAAVMEFGSKKRNIPARPFLSPAHRLMLRKIREDRLFQKFLLEELKRKYIL